NSRHPAPKAGALPDCAIPRLEFGSATRTRTWDPMINSHLLYRLSYRGTSISISPAGLLCSLANPPLRRAILRFSTALSTEKIRFTTIPCEKLQAEEDCPRQHPIQAAPLRGSGAVRIRQIRCRRP